MESFSFCVTLSLIKTYKKLIMAKITLKGNSIKTVGKLPKVGKKAPKFKLVGTDLSTSTLKDFKGKKILLNILSRMVPCLQWLD